MDLAKTIQKGDHFITMTLKPMYYNRRAKHQYKKTIDSVYNMLNIFCDRFVLMPEITEAGNVHYHAAAHFTNKMPYAKERFIDLCKIHKVVGNTKVNKLPITEVNRTADYMIKDYAKTKILLSYKNEDVDFYIIKEYNEEKPIENNNINKKYLDIDI